MRKKHYGLGKHFLSRKFRPTYAPVEDEDATAREETATGEKVASNGEKVSADGEELSGGALKAASGFFGVKDEVESRRKVARKFLMSVPWVVVLIPALFYLDSGEVDSFALSFTLFLVVFCLLAAAGFYYADMPEYHTPVRTGGGTFARLFARVGSFWLLACAFGPFFGWIITSGAVPLTEENWHWRYAARAVLCVAVPLLTALPLVLYVRGKGWFIMALMLLGVTSLPVWSGVNTVLDLREGPVVKRVVGYYSAKSESFYPDAEGKQFWTTILRHTGRSLKITQAPPVEGND